MDMKTIVADWKKNAERHDSRNFDFLHGLKMEDDEDAVDAFAKKLHEEAFSIIDCLQCGHCCRTMGPTFTDAEIERAAERVGMNAAEFTSEYLVKGEPGNEWSGKTLPCPFLAEDNSCTLGDAQPISCAEFPHTDKPGFASRTYQHASNALNCPAVFYIVEQMRKRWVHEEDTAW